MSFPKRQSLDSRKAEDIEAFIFTLIKTWEAQRKNPVNYIVELPISWNHNLDLRTVLEDWFVYYRDQATTSRKTIDILFWWWSDCPFSWTITMPSWNVSWTTCEDFKNLFFQNTNPVCSLTLTPTSNVIERWTNQDAPTLNLSWTDWTNPSWVATSVEYEKDNVNIYTNNSPSGHSDSFDDITVYNTNQNLVYRARVLDDQSRQSNRCVRNYTLSVVLPFYVGRIDEQTDLFTWITQVQLLALADVRKLVKIKSDTDDTTNPTNWRYVIWYPASYWNLSEILDDSNFDTITDYNIVNINVVWLDWTSEAYRFYVLKNDTTQTWFTNHFNF